MSELHGSSHFASPGGLRLHYLEWGRPEAQPIVLLHGGGQSAHTWQRVAGRLSGRYHLIAPDARGHGDSDWAPDRDYTLAAMREDLHGLCGQLGIDRFVLAGMSLGGMTALAYAGTYGETLRGLVVIDIAPDVQREGRERIVGFMRGRESFASLDDAVAYAHAFNPRRSPEALRRTLPRNLKELPDGRLRWKWDPAFLPDGENPESRLGLEDLWAAAARVPCPTLVVHGSESDILNQETGERLASVLPHGRYVTVSGSGHSVQGDNPHSLSEAIEQLLQEIGYRAGRTTANRRTAGPP